MDSSRLAVGLDALVRSVADAESAPDVFRALIEGLPLVAPKAAVFLVRQHDLKGWHGFGYPANIGERLRAFSADARAASSRVDPSGELDHRTGNAPAPNFGQETPHESVTVTIAVKGKPIAMVLVERDASGEPWHPAGLALVSRVARLRLELSLAERRIRAKEGKEPPRSVATPPAQAAAPTPPVEKPSPVEAAGATPIESVVEVRTPAAETPADPRIDAARRFARLLATDIRLYNEEAVVLGRRNRDLADRLDEPITLGRQSFVERYGDMGPTGLELLRQALVDVLAGGDPSLLPPR
jgi:hypothetical protein